MLRLLRMAVVLAFLSIVCIMHAQGPNLLRQSRELTVYVSPWGNDAWSGLLPEANSKGNDGPFQHFDRARQYLAGLDKSRLVQITVLFREGVYQLPATVNFTAADSGTPQVPIVYANFPGETVIFTGGMRVGGWVNLGGNTWQTALPPGTVPFDNLYYNGERRLRPRVGGYLGQYFRTFKTVFVPKSDPTWDKNACPNQDPDSGLYECFDRLQYDPAPADNNNPDADPWTNLVPAPGNLCNQKLIAGSKPLWGNIQILVFEQFSTSKLPVSCVDTDAHIIYTTGPTATPPPNHASEAGFISGNRYLIENVKNALTEPGQWYLDPVAMTLTYLAKPSEVPNRDNVVVPQLPQLLVATGLHDVTFRGLTFEHDNFVVPFPQGHVSTELETDIPGALSFQNSNHIIFDANTVRQTAGTGLTFIPCVNDPSGGTDPNSTPDPECVTTAASPDLSGIVISNSAFYDLGALGIRISGHYLTTFNDLDVPRQALVENNVVEGYGRNIPASFGIGQGFGHDNTYTHNDVYDGYHCAISVTENAGEDKPNGIGGANNTISFNHVYNLLQGIMNDGGAIRVQSGNGAYSAPGNKIWNNKIHDVNDSSVMDANGYGGHGIYMDNETGLVDVENNLVYRVSDAGIYTPHGPTAKPALGYPNEPNLIKNNIVAYARLGLIEEGDPYSTISPPATQPDHVPQSFVVMHNIFYFDRNMNSRSPFQGTTVRAPFNIPAGCAYTPFAYTLYQLFDYNLYWRTDGNFEHDTGFNVQTTARTDGPNAPCGGSRFADMALYSFYDFHDWRTQVNEDQHSFVKDPHFASPGYPWDDFRLFQGLPDIGFVPFDATEAGRRQWFYPPLYPRIDPPAVAPTFVTSTYDPATDF